MRIAKLLLFLIKTLLIKVFSIMLHLLNHKLTLVMLIIAVFGYCYRIAVQTICSEWCSSFGIANLAVGIQLAAANCGGKDHNDRSCLVGCILTTMGISLSMADIV